MPFIQKKRILTAVLLLVWLLVSFGPSFFARDLSVIIGGWPLYFWMAAQGSVLVFICIVVIYAWLMNRWEAQEVASGRDIPKGW
jgi:putative solute:sodium symporter small subunit